MVHSLKTFIFSNRPYKLKTLIILLVTVVLAVSLILTGILIANDYATTTQRNLEDKAKAIASAVGHTSTTLESLRNGSYGGSVQTYTKDVQADTNIEYIVVMDMNSIRLSHPNEEMIGRRFVGGDEGPALAGESYTSVALGTLGESMRAFVPIWDGAEQVGAVAVGMAKDKINDAVFHSQKIILFGMSIGLAAGLVGALLLAQKVKNTMHGLEPAEISKLLEEKEVMLASVREGVVAIDEKGIMVVANPAARDIFKRAGLGVDPIGKNVQEIMPESKLQEVLIHQRAEMDQPQKLNNLEIVVNCVPVKAAGKLVGALATFRDKRELTSMLEQLSGAKNYAESLRVHTHEFMNKLHVISAMVHTESYKELLEYIKQISNYYQKDVGWVSNYVKDPVLAGYLLNKLTFLQGHDVKVTLTGQEAWPSIARSEVLDALTTIIGNSLDNAYEAMAGQEEKEITVELSSTKDGWLEWTVRDNGPGLSEELPGEWIRKGSSTKGEGRGYGMHLIHKAAADTDGTVHISSRKGDGMKLTVRIPYQA
ncbi:DcuS/MalK family sensor histidine kinase [Paenibacillus glucanolyticus]|uniref:DcuS/MalK family sensor histidine kinase n=1 Tax=Paenibacillus glucanolyticus TaxID=59843 RepID=UPI0007B404B6|nr:DcuS/MalK family sensor histidine kinase [Paenibacillus glucanolyticus]ANA79609.1 two-component system sensor histidine kinase DcuS [Paenibacillus glucanolyticus]